MSNPIYNSIAQAVHTAIHTVGIDNVKKMSMFPSAANDVDVVYVVTIDDEPWSVHRTEAGARRKMEETSKLPILSGCVFDMLSLTLLD